MKYFYFLVFFFLILYARLYAQGNFQELFPGKYGNELMNIVQQNYSPTTTLSYNNARDLLYAALARKSNNQLEGLYSGFTITINPDGTSPRTEAYEKGINCEHIWPQSKWTGSSNPKSDLHHLYPTRIEVNAARGSYPFAEIDDSRTDRWYYKDKELSETPASQIDEYSELDFDGYFEPREAKKGDVARAIFYFYTIYHSYADASFFETQKKTLYLWHVMDPPDENETWKNDVIYTLQGNYNPFILDTSLARRIYFPQWKSGQYYLKVLPESEVIKSGKDSTVYFNVSSNAQDWQASSDVTWISLTTDKSSSQIVAHAEANNTSFQREGIITIHSDKAGTENVVLYQWGNPSSSIPVDSNQMKIGLSVYPNPFSDKLTFRFEITEPSNIQILVFDARGQIIKTFLNFYDSPGIYEFNVNTTQWKPGYFYFYFLKNDQEFQNELLLVR